MKKITIGRGRECDIRLDDKTDSVSRKHAIICVPFFGKMRIYDLSSNGTFVNGKKVEKPDPLPVKKGDNVNFAHLVDLDWNKFHNPYRVLRITLIAVIILLAAAAATYFTLGYDGIHKLITGKSVEKVEDSEKDDNETDTDEAEVTVHDTITVIETVSGNQVQPAPTTPAPAQKKKPAAKPSKNKKAKPDDKVKPNTSTSPTDLIKKPNPEPRKNENNSGMSQEDLRKMRS